VFLTPQKSLVYSSLQESRGCQKNSCVKVQVKVKHQDRFDWKVEELMASIQYGEDYDIYIFEDTDQGRMLNVIHNFAQKMIGGIQNTNWKLLLKPESFPIDQEM